MRGAGSPVDYIILFFFACVNNLCEIIFKNAILNDELRRGEAMKSARRAVCRHGAAVDVIRSKNGMASRHSRGCNPFEERYGITAQPWM